MDSLKDKFLMDINEYKEKYGKISHKCENCGKQYKLPCYIFSPRDKICFTCENLEIKRKVLETIL